MPFLAPYRQRRHECVHCLRTHGGMASAHGSHCHDSSTLKSIKGSISEKTRTYVQVGLSDFAQILQVGLLWGVHRHSKARAQSFEGNHEIGIPLNIGPILA